MKDFFFDTANIEFIENTWNCLKDQVPTNSVRGITTNPNAFYKLKKYSINEWFEDLPKLCKVISQIRNDSNGVVYVQIPSSKMNVKDVIQYAAYISTLGDGQTKIALKIPPYKEVLEQTKQLTKFVDVNVTGVADCSTALKCITYGVKFVSIIPGRMEEAGINAKEHLKFIMESNLSNTEIIAGSMRTVEGLQWTFQYGAVPTIGEKLWTHLIDNNKLSLIMNIEAVNDAFMEFSPLIKQENIQLSKDFFAQMDLCGETAFKNWKEIYSNVLQPI